MNRRTPSRRDGRQGNAIIEFALMAPLLILIAMGTADFGRVFYHGITVSNASGTGAAFGALDGVSAGKLTEMEDRARQDAQNLSGVDADATQVCRCPDGTAVACNQILVNTCPGYGVPRAYVRVRVEQQFNTLGPYPGVPQLSDVGRQTWMRVR